MYVACIRIGNYIARALMNLFVNFVMLLSTLPTAFLTLYTIPRENEGTAVPSFSLDCIYLLNFSELIFFVSFSNPITSDSRFRLHHFSFRFPVFLVCGLRVGLGRMQSDNVFQYFARLSLKFSCNLLGKIHNLKDVGE